MKWLLALAALAHAGMGPDCDPLDRKCTLPAPQREYVVWQDPDKSLRKAPTPKSRAPPYGRRRGFVPRSIADFGDGGAFPEIHVAQYPLGMGTKEDKAAQQKGRMWYRLLSDAMNKR